MISIFIGLCLVMPDIELKFNGFFAFDLFPDFIGYIILLRGLSQLSRESEKINRMRPFAAFLAVYAIVEYALKASGLVYTVRGLLSSGLMIAGIGLSMMVVFNIIEGLHEIEVDRKVDLKSKLLHKVFIPWVISSVIVVIFSFAAPDDTPSIAGDVSSVATWILLPSVLLFLAVFFIAVRNYRALPPKEEPAPAEQKRKRPWEES